MQVCRALKAAAVLCGSELRGRMLQ